MTYRIKIITYGNGRKEYIPQKKVWWGWAGLTWDGEETGCDLDYKSRESALERIDLNYAGSGKRQNIEFEYINKA